MRGERSGRGGRNITKSVPTAAWDTKLRKSSLLLRPRASTGLNWGKRPQTPAPCPRPPSPLKPEMEQNEFAVFLRERKQGAGQTVDTKSQPGLENSVTSVSDWKRRNWRRGKDSNPRFRCGLEHTGRSFATSCRNGAATVYGHRGAGWPNRSS